MTTDGPDLGPLPIWHPPGYRGPRNGLGIVALVLGILSLLLSITVVFGIGLGLVALLLGVLGWRRAKQGGATNGGMAMTGAVLGAVSVLIGGALVAFVANVSSEQSKLYKECRDRATDDEMRAACKEEFEPGAP